MNFSNESFSSILSNRIKDLKLKSNEQANDTDSKKNDFLSLNPIFNQPKNRKLNLKKLNNKIQELINFKDSYKEKKVHLPIKYRNCLILLSSLVKILQIFRLTRRIPFFDKIKEPVENLSNHSYEINMLKVHLEIVPDESITAKYYQHRRSVVRESKFKLSLNCLKEPDGYESVNQYINSSAYKYLLNIIYRAHREFCNQNNIFILPDDEDITSWVEEFDVDSVELPPGKPIPDPVVPPGQTRITDYINSSITVFDEDKINDNSLIYNENMTKKNIIHKENMIRNTNRISPYETEVARRLFELVKPREREKIEREKVSTYGIKKDDIVTIADIIVIHSLGPKKKAKRLDDVIKSIKSSPKFSLYSDDEIRNIIDDLVSYTNRYFNIFNSRNGSYLRIDNFNYQDIRDNLKSLVLI